MSASSGVALICLSVTGCFSFSTGLTLTAAHLPSGSVGSVRPPLLMAITPTISSPMLEW